MIRWDEKIRERMGREGKEGKTELEKRRIG